MVNRYAWLLILPLLGCPKPGPVPTPTPPPIPMNCCNVPGPNEPGWKEVTPEPAPFNALFVDEAEHRLGSLCGGVPDENLQKLAENLVAQNLCAAKWADAVLILRPDGLWEEWHTVAYTDGCWTRLDRAYIGAWTGPAMKGCK